MRRKSPQLQAMNSPSSITSLGPNEVFVFGSNRAGRHGAGAARLALKWGAKYGWGHGRQGQTYAIATLDERLQKVPLLDIEHEVNEFIWYASNNLNDTFLVTEIGCGLAGYRVDEIAPMFAHCNLLNVLLPKRFNEYNGK